MHKDRVTANMLKNSDKVNPIHYEIFPALPGDSSAICDYLSAVGRETKYTTIEPTGFWLDTEEEEAFIKELEESKKGVLMLAKASLYEGKTCKKALGLIKELV